MVWKYLNDSRNNLDSFIMKCMNVPKLWIGIVMLIVAAIVHYVLLIVYIRSNESFFQSHSILIAVAMFSMVAEINQHRRLVSNNDDNVNAAFTQIPRSADLAEDSKQEQDEIGIEMTQRKTVQRTTTI